jgi:hypothetical protein
MLIRHHFSAIAVSSLITFILITVGPCHLKSSYSKPLTNFKLSWKRPFNVILFGDSLIRNPNRGYDLLGRISALLPQTNLNLIDMGEGGNKINDMLLRIEEVNIYLIHPHHSNYYFLFVFPYRL